MPSALGKPSTLWRKQSVWSKVWTYTLLALMVVFTTEAGIWPDDSSSHRKRVFSPGFVVLCVFVAVVELIVLNHFYGVPR
ncbi:hypothetical protein PspCFBP13528_17395 [Pseudomonas sp. CFBP13528]|uniref:hypothetical protein n=1 Tax=Pseudomonas sp. CFBP13528 TaxID=2184006 RepID=UPI0010C1099B|nr:hypothetical protein [Pseudomonas sp. CFBP13528]TKK29510.1 hypothetical protein PspCFBP13528_17395 [Pseudomonas sp. CFBP13528]